MDEAHKFTGKLGTSLSLEYPEPSCRFVSDLEKEIIGPKVKEHLKKEDMGKLKERINEERWQRRLLQARGQDSVLSQKGCCTWTCAPIHTISRVMELYDQLHYPRVVLLPIPSMRYNNGAL